MAIRPSGQSGRQARGHFGIPADDLRVFASMRSAMIAQRLAGNGRVLWTG